MDAEKEFKISNCSSSDNSENSTSVSSLLSSTTFILESVNPFDCKNLSSTDVFFELSSFVNSLLSEKKSELSSVSAEKFICVSCSS